MQRIRSILANIKNYTKRLKESLQNRFKALFNYIKSIFMKAEKTDTLFDLLEIIHKTCIDKAPTKITSGNESKQVRYMYAMYSIVVELTGDSYQAVKSRKELASCVLTRAFLEAVVILRNVIKDPDHFYVRSQRSLAKGVKPLKYLLDNPDLIDTAKHPIEDVKELSDKHGELRDLEIKQSSIRDDFENVGMEHCYYTIYAFLCNYSHHDPSVIIKRHIGINVRPLDEKTAQKITKSIVDLILKASISFHKFLKTDQVDVFKDLQQRWQAIPCDMSSK